MAMCSLQWELWSPWQVFGMYLHMDALRAYERYIHWKELATYTYPISPMEISLALVKVGPKSMYLYRKYRVTVRAWSYQHLHIYAFMYICVYVYMHACVCVCTYVRRENKEKVVLGLIELKKMSIELSTPPQGIGRVHRVERSSGSVKPTIPQKWLL